MRELPDIVILGLTVTSSWGNGHATTWRGLIRGLAARGYRILFLERDAPWYASNRDDPNPEGATTVIYESFEDLSSRFEREVSQAALVIVGSYVPDGSRVGEWVTSVANGKCAFYDIDTPITMSLLDSGRCEYISAQLIGRYDAYFSFAAGPTLRKLESKYGSPMARPLYCSVDQDKYYPAETQKRWDLGYLGTYSADRQCLVDELLVNPACQWSEGQFAVAGPQYPDSIQWPANVERFVHLSPGEHAAFYSSQRFTLNVTRQAMKSAGHSPSVRLFEAGACGVPVISDWWEGLETLFRIGDEVLVAERAEDTLRYLRDIPEPRRLSIGQSARNRVLAEHTPAARALQIEGYLKEMNDQISSCSARRNRFGGEGSGWMESGLSPQPDGERAGEPLSRDSFGVTHSSDIHKPVGARN
jgi:spore maturation protein CgeB